MGPPKAWSASGTRSERDQNDIRRHLRPFSRFFADFWDLRREIFLRFSGFGLETPSNGQWKLQKRCILWTAVAGLIHIDLRPCRPSTAVSSRKPKKKFPKSLPGPSGPESQKSPEKVEKSPKSVRKVSFWGLFDLFGTFLRLRAGRPGKTFWRLFRGFRPGGARDCRRWPARTQTLMPFSPPIPACS